MKIFFLAAGGLSFGLLALALCFLFMPLPVSANYVTATWLIFFAASGLGAWLCSIEMRKIEERSGQQRS